MKGCREKLASNKPKERERRERERERERELERGLSE